MHSPGKMSADRVLRDGAFNIAENPVYGGYRHGFASMVYNFFFDKQTVSGGDFNSKILSSECLSDLALSELAKERHKKIIRRFEKRKVH